MIRISSDINGTSSRVRVTGGTANAALGFSTAEESGSGNVASLEQVTGAEVRALVEGEVAGAAVAVNGSGQLEIATVDAGALATVQVGVDTAAAFGFDVAGSTAAEDETDPAKRLLVRLLRIGWNRLQADTAERVLLVEDV